MQRRAHSSPSSASRAAFHSRTSNSSTRSTGTSWSPASSGSVAIWPLSCEPSRHRGTMWYMNRARKSLAIAGITGLLAVGAISANALGGDGGDQEVRIIPASDEADETTTTEAEVVETTTTAAPVTTSTEAPVVTVADIPVTTEAQPVSSPTPTNPPAAPEATVASPEPTASPSGPKPRDPHPSTPPLPTQP